MSEAVELEPCPFCGGPAEIWRATPGTTRKAWIACMGRCVAISKERETDAEAVAAWNRRAALKTEGEPVAWREGYKLVPVEPTEAMLQAGAAAARDFMSERGPYPRTRAVFAAMLAAAPQAPASPTKEEIARVVLAIVFERAQPNRGDVFSWLDDNIEPIADTILSLMSVETSNA